MKTFFSKTVFGIAGSVIALAIFAVVYSSTLNADELPIETLIATTIQSSSRSPNITSVTVKNCRIEIKIAYSELNNCEMPESADFGETVISLIEIDKIYLCPQTSQGMLIDFVFTPEVSAKIEQALIIARPMENSPITLENGGALNAQAISPAARAINFLRNENIEFQNTITSCNGMKHVQIISSRAATIMMKSKVSQQFFRNLHEYHLSCNQSR